jgi:membrane associated rhomboid family serine protease
MAFDSLGAMQNKNHPFGSGLEALVFPLYVLIAMWLVFWGDHLFSQSFFQYGVLPRSVEGLKGILFMPLIHSTTDFKHIVNNSIPIYLLLAALVYFYRAIAVRVFFLGWILTGALVWLYAENKGSYHIGMSGLIYLLAAFLFVSGVLRKFKPLQAISLFVAFLYGGMFWGVFPLEEKVSWEGHLMGFSVGVFFAFFFQNHGPQRPKYQYEIEKEMGIEPPDLEGMYLSSLQEERDRIAATQLESEQNQSAESPPTGTNKVAVSKEIIYHYIPTDKDK